MSIDFDDITKDYVFMKLFPYSNDINRFEIERLFEIFDGEKKIDFFT